MKHLIFILFILALIPSVSATQIGIQPNPIELTLNETKDLEFNLTITDNVSGVLFLNINLPFLGANIEPNKITFPNGTHTYFPVLHFDIEPSFPARLYPGWLEYVIGDEGGKVNVTINVTEKKIYDIVFIEEKNVICGGNGIIVVNLTNQGNVDLTLNLISNSTLIRPATSTVTIFRQGTERVTFFYTIPNNLTPGTHNAKIYFENDSYVVKFKVTDKTKPEIFTSPLPALKVGEDFSINIQARDNVDLKEIYVDVVCEDIPAQKYMFQKMFQNNYTADVPGIIKPTECVANIYAIDTSDNQNLTQIYFNIDYLYGFNINELLTIPKFKTDFMKKVVILEANESINVTLKLVNLNHPNITNESHSFDVGVDNGNQFERFEQIKHEIILNGKKIYLNIKSDVIGEFSGKILVTLPEYITEDNVIEVEFDGVVGRYTVVEPYQGSLYGISLECNPYDLGTFDTSYQLCKLKLPIDINPAEVTLPVSLRQIGLTDENYDLRLKQAIEPKDRAVSALYSWIASIITFFIIILAVVYVYYKKDVIFYIGGG